MPEPSWIPSKLNSVGVLTKYEIIILKRFTYSYWVHIWLALLDWFPTWSSVAWTNSQPDKHLRQNVSIYLKIILVRCSRYLKGVSVSLTDLGSAHLLGDGRNRRGCRTRHIWYHGPQLQKRNRPGEIFGRLYSFKLEEIQQRTSLITKLGLDCNC